MSNSVTVNWKLSKEQFLAILALTNDQDSEESQSARMELSDGLTCIQEGDEYYCYEFVNGGWKLVSGPHPDCGPCNG